MFNSLLKISIVVLLVFVLATVLGCGDNSTKTDLEEAKNQLEKKDAHISQLEKENDKLVAKLDDAEDNDAVEIPEEVTEDLEPVMKYNFQEGFVVKEETTEKVDPDFHGTVRGWVSSLDSDYRFTFDNALKSQERIESWVYSNSDRIEGDGVIAFPNWFSSTKVVLLKQNYQISKLEYELAKKAYEQGETNLKTVENKKDSYKEAIDTIWEWEKEMRFAE